MYRASPRPLATTRADGACAECGVARDLGHSLVEMGEALMVPSGKRWEPLDGVDALREHPDPLGALQRGEVPALVLRGAVPSAALRRLRARMALFAHTEPTEQGGYGHREYQQRSRCALALNAERCPCDKVTKNRTEQSWSGASVIGSGGTVCSTAKGSKSVCDRHKYCKQLLHNVHYAEYGRKLIHDSLRADVSTGRASL